MTTTLNREQVLEYFAHGVQKGKINGAFSEREMILGILSDPDFHEEVDRNWRGDATIYEVIVKILRSRLAESTR